MDTKCKVQANRLMHACIKLAQHVFSDLWWTTTNRQARVLYTREEQMLQCWSAVHVHCVHEDQMVCTCSNTHSLNRLEETLASVHRSQSACEALEVPGEYWHLVLLTTHRGTSLLFSWLASMLSGAASSTSDWPPSPLIVHFLQTLTCSSMVLREPGAQAGSLSRHLYYDSPSHSESWRSSCSLYVIIYTGSWVRG